MLAALKVEGVMCFWLWNIVREREIVASHRFADVCYGTAKRHA
jgi:hypothetical protein